MLHQSTMAQHTYHELRHKCNMIIHFTKGQQITKMTYNQYINIIVNNVFYQFSVTHSCILAEKQSNLLILCCNTYCLDVLNHVQRFGLCCTLFTFYPSIIFCWDIKIGIQIIKQRYTCKPNQELIFLYEYILFNYNTYTLPVLIWLITMYLFINDPNLHQKNNDEQKPYLNRIYKQSTTSNQTDIVAYILIF